MSMLYRIVLTKLAEKELDNFDHKTRKRLFTAFDVLRENPTAGKQLQGEHKGLRSLRVWPYRVLYAVDHDIITVTILKVGHRKDVYR